MDAVVWQHKMPHDDVLLKLRKCVRVLDVVYEFDTHVVFGFTIIFKFSYGNCFDDIMGVYVCESMFHSIYKQTNKRTCSNYFVCITKKLEKLSCRRKFTYSLCLNAFHKRSCQNRFIDHFLMEICNLFLKLNKN